VAGHGSVRGPPGGELGRLPEGDAQRGGTRTGRAVRKPRRTHHVQTCPSLLPGAGHLPGEGQRLLGQDRLVLAALLAVLASFSDQSLAPGTAGMMNGMAAPARCQSVASCCGSRRPGCLRARRSPLSRRGVRSEAPGTGSRALRCWAGGEEALRKAGPG
jgi:hypothetical protein